MTTGKSGFTKQAVLVVVFIIVLVGIIYLAKQLRSVEETLAYRPPMGDPEFVISDVGEGQAVYIPVYSHIYQEEGNAYLLTITLSLRNIDPKHSIVVKSVLYYNTSGSLLKSYLDHPLRLGPMASTEFLVREEDSEGGAGANFIVQWASKEQVNQPIIEAVMIGTSDVRSISFVSRGEPIKLSKE